MVVRTRILTSSKTGSDPNVMVVGVTIIVTGVGLMCEYDGVEFVGGAVVTN